MSIIKSFSVGNGDMFYINHNSDNFTVIDCCIPDEVRDDILDEITPLWNAKNIQRFISTHPDDDHICGLKNFDKKLKIYNFYCVKNSTTKDEPTDDFKHYCSLHNGNKAFYISAGCTRRWMNKSGYERSSAGISILWPKTKSRFFQEALKEANNSGRCNNISPIIKYKQDSGVTVLWFGDLENSFMENIENEISLPQADIVFAPHHGRKSGRLPKSWLEEISPQIIVIGEADSKDLDYYSGYNTITQNSAGNITFVCDHNVDIYVSNKSYNGIPPGYGENVTGDGYYIGTLDFRD